MEMYIPKKRRGFKRIKGLYNYRGYQLRVFKAFDEGDEDGIYAPEWLWIGAFGRLANNVEIGTILRYDIVSLLKEFRKQVNDNIIRNNPLPTFFTMNEEGEFVKLNKVKHKKWKK